MVTNDAPWDVNESMGHTTDMRKMLVVKKMLVEATMGHHEVGRQDARRARPTMAWRWIVRTRR